MRKSLAFCVIVCLFRVSLGWGVELPDIRYNAIVEAPVERVWSVVADRGRVSKWLFHSAEQWTPVADRPYRVNPFGKEQVTGTIVKADRPRLIQLTWPKPAGTLTIEITSIDEHLTMISLVHTGWTDETPELKREYQEVKQRWLVAMVKLHRQFPPSLVDTKMHRPKDVPGLFVKASLIANGDFEFAEPGKYEGVAFGWETNTARPSPEVHVIDNRVSNDRGRSQCIRHPKDWTNYAIQQWTTHLEPMIEPGKRYRLTGWVKADGITNLAGWYRLGLWFMDKQDRPIGDFLKNDQPADADGKPLLNHDWLTYTIEATAPPGAARAVVILTGHWDEAGTVWYDDIRLWEADRIPRTKR